MCALSSHLTSGCVRRRSRGPPVRAPEEARARFHCGRRPFGPGRCMQHAAPRPCMGRQRARTALDSQDIKIKPLLRRTRHWCTLQWRQKENKRLTWPRLPGWGPDWSCFLIIAIQGTIMMNTQWTAEILLGLLTLPVLSRHDGFLSHHDKEVWNKSLKGKKRWMRKPKP